MKRDPRLQGLSREHHRALVMARRATDGRVGLEEMRAFYEQELRPHFAIEERDLVPAMPPSLATRTVREHEAIRAALARGDVAEAGRQLTEHVRFEERELFPECERRLFSVATS